MEMSRFRDEKKIEESFYLKEIMVQWSNNVDRGTRKQQQLPKTFFNFRFQKEITSFSYERAM